MAEKENQRVRLTKQLLKTSLMELMKEKPIGKIHVKEICENAEINRSTFYVYYPDPYALLDEIQNELVAHVREHLDKIDSDAVSETYLEALMEYIRDHADIFRTLLCRQDNMLFQSGFVEASLSNLRKGVPLKESETVNEYIYVYLIMGCLSMIKRWIEADFDMPCQEMASLLFTLSDSAVVPFAQIVSGESGDKGE